MTRAAALLLVALLPRVAGAQAEPDGNDDRPAVLDGTRPTRGHWERVGRPAGALRRVCDLTPFQGGLYLAQSQTPLGSDGARVFRYAPGPAPFRLAFDWNRPGEPTPGGGGGQGFLRVRALDGRLAVPDADPPYNGLGAVDPGTEGYVFLSDRAGNFAPPAMPGHRLPPRFAPDRDTPGVALLPRAYHVLDVIRWRGQWVASTGSVPPRARAWVGPSPGALHVGAAQGPRWTYAVGYPADARNNVWRLTYLVRFRGRLYAGLQDYFGRDPNDLVVFDPPPDGRPLSTAPLRPLRVTPHGGAYTLRWLADRGRLWWLTWERDRRGHLRYTDDGAAWHELPLPATAGAPTDLLRWRDGLVLLTADGLYRLDGDVVTRVAEAPTATAWVRGRRVTGSHFRFDDAFCAAPLAAYEGALYAGSQRDGSLWRLVAE